MYLQKAVKLNPSDLNGRLLLVQIHLLKVKVLLQCLLLVIVIVRMQRFSFDCRKFIGFSSLRYTIGLENASNQM